MDNEGVFTGITAIPVIVPRSVRGRDGRGIPCRIGRGVWPG
jgi:hypothetical protein